MPSLDTNCLLRWLLGDIPEQTASVTAFINSGKSVVVADVALIETVFVLEKIKKISRETSKKQSWRLFKKRQSCVIVNSLLKFSPFIPATPNYPLSTAILKSWPEEQMLRRF